MTQPKGEPTRYSCELQVRVQPRASRSQITGFRAGPGEGPAKDVLHLRVTAPPEGGKANAAVLTLLAKTLKLPPGSISIVKGSSSRDKAIRVNTLTLQQVKERLAAA